MLETDIRNLLKREFGLDSSSLGTEDALFSSGLLDSLSSVNLLAVLETEFGVTISPLDVSIEDVDSIASVMRTIERLRE